MFGKKKKKQLTEVNASSMADIAFLLLIFFLVTTTIASDKGLSILLPPKVDKQEQVKFKERNIFTVLINSDDQMLVEGELMDVRNIKEKAKKFIGNKGADETSSESTEKAIISLKTDRGTSYELYINVMDELKRAYNELRAESVGLSLQEYNDLDAENPEQKKLMEKSKLEYPLQISEAEPTDIGG